MRTPALIVLLTAVLCGRGSVSTGQELDKSQDVAIKFLNALNDKDVDAAMKAAAVPWLTEQRKVVKDEQQLRAYLKQQVDAQGEKKYALEAKQSAPFADAMKDVKQQADRKLLEQVMGKDDRVILLGDKSTMARRYMLVRKLPGGYKVVGGPFKLTYLVVPNSMPEEIWKFLAGAKKLEILLLDPTPPKDKSKDDFHGWKVLGKAAVQDASIRKKLVAALRQGIEESEGTSADCFKPRHGLRASSGAQVLDFVICFECFQMHVYNGEKKIGGVMLTASPQATFNQVLMDAKVTPAESK